nr:putative F-box/LRR-repeat protein 23 isoform X2 [Lolium perenne]
MDALPASELHARDWSEIPLPALTLLFAKLSAVDILMGAGLVCQSWLETAKSPCLWREVDMSHSHKPCYKLLVEECAMAKVAVDRSSGQLEAFTGEGFVTDDLLKYIGERSPSLKCLGLISCIDVSIEGFTELLDRSPLLEDLTVMGCDNIEDIACPVAAGACPQLKRLVLYKRKRSSSHSPLSFTMGTWICRRYVRSEYELRIETMRELRELTLVGSDIDAQELDAVVDGCPHLEHLCLIDCCNLEVPDALRAKCARIKKLELCSYEDNDTCADAFTFQATEFHRNLVYWRSEVWM